MQNPWRYRGKKFAKKKMFVQGISIRAGVQRECAEACYVAFCRVLKEFLENGYFVKLPGTEILCPKGYDKIPKHIPIVLEPEIFPPIDAEGNVIPEYVERYNMKVAQEAAREATNGNGG